MKIYWFGRPGFPVWMLALAMLTTNSFATTHNVEQSLAEVLRERVSGAQPAGVLPVQGGPIRTLATLTKVYDERGYVPLWIDASGLTRSGQQLIDVLATTEEHGIAPARYRLTLIRALANAVAAGAKETRADLDLLLTDAFLMHAADLVSGRVDPASLDPLWAAQKRFRDLPRVIEQAALGQPGEILADLAPPHPQYAALREALRRLRLEYDTAADWPSVPHGPVLELGNSGDRVVQLNRSLVRLGYLAPDQSGENYSEPTRDAVRQFQRDNGLEPDGMAGPKTLAQLNEFTPSAQARRIAVNLERWRWLPDDLGTRNLQVNIAAYDLRLQDDGNTELTMKVIVGREARRSPVMSARMTYLVLNPSWNVPRKIAVQDKLPQFRDNPALLDQQGFEVLSGWAENAQPLDPDAIDWATLGPRNFPYRLRQRPGPQNALGRVKFMFPNKFDVYLHDTPARELFSREERAFSSGCIRVEHPLALALALLRDDPAWTPSALENTVAKGTERIVKLPQPILVHLLYWTAWVDPAGRLRFRRDLYGRDSLLSEALREADGV